MPTNLHSLYLRDRYHNDPIYREKIRAYNNEWRKTHRDRDWALTHINQSRLIKARYRERLRLEVLSHYSNGSPKCSYCGITDVEVLTIDHINNDGAKQRRVHGEGTHFCIWLRKNNYPEGFQILCFNCNWKKRRKSDIIKILRESD